MTFSLYPLTDEHRAWLRDFLTEHWGSHMMVSRGRLYDASADHAVAAVQAADMFGDAPVIGVATYTIDGAHCELTTIRSVQEKIGVGGALIAAVKDAARAAGCEDIWLITTNDNLNALRFYQKRGFRIAAVHVNAMDISRRLKPSIPLIGLDGIALRDEIELEIEL